MSFDLLKAVPIIHVTLSNMKRAVFHDGWSLSSPNYHHTDQYLTVNIDILVCMVSTPYLVQICRDADMQIGTNFPGSKVTHTKWSYRSIWIRLLSKCAPEAIARPSGNLTNLIMGVFYTVRNIVSLLFPPWGSQPWLMKQINTLYIGCISWESVKNLKHNRAKIWKKSNTKRT